MIRSSSGNERGAAEPLALVVASGKGGVGKSVTSIMLATALAGRGRRVLLVDADQTLGNLHVLLGVAPARRVHGLLRADTDPAELLRPVADRLWLLPADAGAEAVYPLGALEQARLHHRVVSLYDRFDAVVIDTAAGLESAMRAAIMRGSRVVTVTVPEPAALNDAYGLIKVLTLQLPDLPVDVLVNRAADEADASAAFERLAGASRRLLRRGLRYLGAVPEDPIVRSAVRDPHRLLAMLGESRAADALESAATRFDPFPISTPTRCSA